MQKTWIRKLGWFAALWLASVAILSIVAYAIKLFI